MLYVHFITAIDIDETGKIILVGQIFTFKTDTYKAANYHHVNPNNNHKYNSK